MITLGDVINQAEDYVGNYTTSNLQPGSKIRAANRSIETIKRKLGLPSDEMIFNFLFSDDQMFVDLPTHFDESIMLKYKDNNYNTPQYEWEYFIYPEILRNLGNRKDFRYSFTTINGRKQLLLTGNNIVKGDTLFNFESIGNWVAQDDASDLEVDNTVYYSSGGSLKFDIVNNLGVATLSNPNVAYDFKNLFQRNGFIKFWTYLTDDNIDDITIKLFTDSLNYFVITKSTQDNGNAFSENEWIKIGFPTNEATEVGSPDSSNITRIDVEWSLGSGFTSAVDFRIDQMFTTYPDEMELIFYTSIKGTDSTGAVTKTYLDDLSDKLLIGDFFDDYIDVIARKTAINIWPQLIGDKEFYIDFKNDWNDMLKTLGRVYPRKRTMINSYRHRLMR